MADNAVSQVKGKEVAEVSDEELAGLLEQSQKHQAKENASDGVKADYIILAKSGTKALKKSQADLYIPELKQGDFFIQKTKTVLGDEIKVVPLAFITLYDEMTSDGKDAQFFGTWSKEQASAYPLVEGSYFNRKLPNGHILCPKNWVMVEVIDHPEIENAVIAYKKTGARIWKQWKEDAKGRSGTCATLVYTLAEKVVSNEDNEWTDIGFAFTENLIETDKAMAVKCLRKSNALREAYENHTLVAPREVEAPAERPAIADASETADSALNDEEVDF